MRNRTLRTWAVVAVTLTAVGALLGGLLQHDEPASGALIGAALGLSVAVAAALHLAVRTADGRGVAAREPEAKGDSVERRVWLEASSRTCVDAVSVMVLVALVCAWSGDAALTRWLPLVGVAVIAVDLGVRVRTGWRAGIGVDA